MKCNCKFVTQYAYINDKITHIDNYIPNKSSIPKCINNHELIFANGKRKKKYFRHKNREDLDFDNPMTKWHSEWQSNFPITEKTIKKKEGQIRERRCDVFLEKINTILEFQHSKIDRENVVARNNDYKLHNFDIIWIIDGNQKDDIIIEPLYKGGYLIIFNKNKWIYDSFNYDNIDYILLDVDDKIFKIHVKEVKHDMIIVNNYIEKEEVIKLLLEHPEQIFKIWNNEKIIRATLTISQKGAGNGKTFGLCKSISENKDKELFMCFVKQHSAKYVIKQELDEQIKRGEKHIEDNMIEIEDKIYGKKIIINYKNKQTGKNITIIIATIDSFIYNITTNNAKTINLFEGLLKTIINNKKCNKILSNGIIKYANGDRSVNKKTQIWIDEVQDLESLYFDAFYILMLQTGVDINIIGDKLQSLQYEENFLTNALETNLEGITKIIEPFINNNHRIKVQGMSKEINNLVKFEKYNLPSIQTNENDLYKTNTENIKVFKQQEQIYANEKNKEKIDVFCNDVMEYYKYEVINNKMKPSDFLIIFPIMKNNSIALELDTKIQSFWLDYNNDSDCKLMYSFVHKHTEGQVIDLSISENATRIVSIRSSKGDGRKVVFILSMTQASLQVVSNKNNPDNLIYESHIHVALTRSKIKTYISILHNNDDIHKRFYNNDYIDYIPKIKHKFSINDIMNNIDKEKILSLIENNIIEPIDDSNEKKELIDWSYYEIRYPIYLYYAFLSIININKTYKSSQVKKCFECIEFLPVTVVSTDSYWDYLKKSKKKNDKNTILWDDLEYIPILRLSENYDNKNKDAYNLKEKIEIIQKKIKNDELNDIEPLEMIILHYIIELNLKRDLCNISPKQIYEIMNYFDDNNNNNNILNIFNSTENIQQIINKFFENEIVLTGHNWNIGQYIVYNGYSDNLKIMYNSQIIGYDDDNVYHLSFKTEYNKLNYKETVLNILIERFIIFNSKQNKYDQDKNRNKFNGKKIHSYIFILNERRYIKVNMDSLEKNDEFLNELKKAIVNYYINFNNDIYRYYNYIKNKSNVWVIKTKTEEKKFNNPIQYMSELFKTNNYLKQMFDNLWYEIDEKNNKEYVINITNDKELFIEKINFYINKMCNLFFGIIDSEYNNNNEHNIW